MPKMNTIEQRAVGVCNLDEHNEARIERNLFNANGTTWEALRFCKNKDGQHNRVHLVLDENKFVELFEDAIKNGVFHQHTIGSFEDGLGAPRPVPGGDRNRYPMEHSLKTLMKNSMVRIPREAFHRFVGMGRPGGSQGSIGTKPLPGHMPRQPSRSGAPLRRILFWTRR